jgi:hypothetical protein
MSTYDLSLAYSIEVFSLACRAGPRMTRRVAGDLRALARRRRRLRLRRERPASALSDLQPEGTRALDLMALQDHADSLITALLLASVAARDAWLFLWTSRPFLKQVRALTDALGFA